MEILYRVSINSKKHPAFFEAIINLGIEHTLIELPGGGGNLLTFVIEESNANWNTISRFMEISQITGMVETRFSDDDIKEAEWLRLISTFEQSYPQPKPHWPLKQVSRELLCSKCAIYQQVAPMRLAKEPHLGKKSFMTLIWTNEILCTPEVIEGLEQIHAQGYEVWDAVIHKIGRPSEKVRQLYIPQIAQAGVKIDVDLKRTICPVCGETKYYPHVRGTMKIKREALLPETDFMLTHEWFGHGLFAWREILVSNRIARFILDKGWQGVRFKVVEII